MTLHSPFNQFISEVRGALALPGKPRHDLLNAIAQCLGTLVATPGWLNSALTVPLPTGYRRESLFEDADGSFSVGSFTWGPGQASPIHDHQSWGVIGVLAGPLRSETFTLDTTGKASSTGAPHILPTGAVAWVDPQIGDIHRIGAASDHVSISIHVYGCRFSEVNRTFYESANP